MRVLMFGWEFPPHQSGGLATATVGLVKGLLGTGVEVTLVVPFEADRSPLDGLRLVGVASAGGRDVYGDIFARVGRFAAAAPLVAASEPHDVIDAHDWITFDAGLRARDVSGRPLVAHIHATEYDRAGENVHTDIVRREREGMQRADRVIANSRTLGGQVISRYGVDGARVDVVHWGLDAASPAAPASASALSPFEPDVPVVLFVGRITRQKGPGFFVEMAERVSHYVPDARFLVAGNGDLLPWMVERVSTLGLTDRFHFAGALSPADVSRAYASATVCVMPSVSEPFGLVALESVRHGTPCVVARGAGVAEVLENAIKIDFWDIEEMTSQIVGILRNPALREELSACGIDELALPRFTLDEPAHLTRNAYERALMERTQHA